MYLIDKKTRTRDRELSVEEQLFVSKAKGGRLYRPDFIIRRKDTDEQIFIEVLGSNDEEYIRQKKLITGIAKEYCTDYISIKGYRYNKEREDFVSQINSIIGR